MKNPSFSARWILAVVAAAGLAGCVTETVVESPPSIKFPEQKKEHSFWDWFHFGSKSKSTTKTEVESPYPLYAPPAEPQ
jgi:hypothetical protein